MRDDLQLNHITHLKRRVQWLDSVREAVRTNTPTDPDFLNWVGRVTARDAELSSLTRQYLAEAGLF